MSPSRIWRRAIGTNSSASSLPERTRYCSREAWKRDSNSEREIGVEPTIATTESARGARTASPDPRGAPPPGPPRPGGGPRAAARGPPGPRARPPPREKGRAARPAPPRPPLPAPARGLPRARGLHWGARPLGPLDAEAPPPIWRLAAEP